MMRSEVLDFCRREELFSPGEEVICALSGGADSMAMLWCLHSLQAELDIHVSAAHFNHCLRGADSEGDEEFVRSFCEAQGIVLHTGRGDAAEHARQTGKSIEEAARELRYDYLLSLPCHKLATAHHADDNGETVLQHLLRGSGLRGLLGIPPKREKIVRPLLCVTRERILDYLRQEGLSWREDGSNLEDDCLRNRLRHGVMPLLKAENPSFAVNASQMAMELREDAAALEYMEELPPVSQLRQMMPAMRSRALAKFLKANGVLEPERSHIRLAEALVFSEKPSAKAMFPGGVQIGREYDRLVLLEQQEVPMPVTLHIGDVLQLPGWGVTVRCVQAEEIINTKEIFTVHGDEEIVLRSRQTGDRMRLNIGTCTLKKLFADRKIPAHRRAFIPVVADAQGVLGVWGIGANVDRLAHCLPAMQIRFEPLE